MAGWGGAMFGGSNHGGVLGGALIRVTRRQAMPYHAKPSQARRQAREARREAMAKAKARSRGGTKGEGDGEEATA